MGALRSGWFSRSRCILLPHIIKRFTKYVVSAIVFMSPLLVG